MIRNQEISKALELLNEWLASQNKKLELHLIGGVALEWHEINIGRFTEDVDNVLPVESRDITEKICQIGKDLDLPEWFDFSASSIILPRDYKTRLKNVKGFSHITIKLLSLDDLICLKMAAFFQRQEKTTRDYSDLKSIGITSAQLEEGIRFIRQNYRPDIEHFVEDFERDLESTKEKLEELLK